MQKIPYFGTSSIIQFVIDDGTLIFLPQMVNSISLVVATWRSSKSSEYSTGASISEIHLISLKFEFTATLLNYSEVLKFEIALRLDSLGQI